MKKLTSILCLAALFFLTVSCSHHSHKSNEHHESHHHHAEAKLELNDGKKWETDESLRKGMTEIKKIAAANLSKVNKDSMDAKRFTDIATKVDSQIQFLIKNCKLPEDADAQLHVLVAKMVGAAHKMKDSSELSDRKVGFFEVVEAVNTYGDYFDHPNWTKLKLK